jgi:hypothetical protein
VAPLCISVTSKQTFIPPASHPTMCHQWHRQLVYTSNWSRDHSLNHG